MCFLFYFFSEDSYANDSIQLLQRSGIDFNKHQKNGIDVFEFGALLMSSGIVLSDSVKWIRYLFMNYCRMAPLIMKLVSRKVFTVDMILDIY
jgi:hypothetical protein